MLFSMQTKNGCLALIVWAIDRDCLGIPFLKAWGWFQRDVWSMYKTYTDPNDVLLFCKNLVGKNPLDVFVDYVLAYARCHVISGIRDYGKYNEQIINYHK